MGEHYVVLEKGVILNLYYMCYVHENFPGLVVCSLLLLLLLVVV